MKNLKARMLSKMKKVKLKKSYNKKMLALFVVTFAAVGSAALLRASAGPNDTVFFEDFTGNTGLDKFKTGIFHRERDAFDKPEWVGTDPWLGDHDENCSAPEIKRQISTTMGDEASFYSCKDHLMTSIGPVSGYSVGWFSPNQVYSEITEVCWDVNLSSNILGHRQWWEVSISPAGSEHATAINWLAGTANLPDYGDVGAVVLGFGPDNPPYHKLSIGNDSVQSGSVSVGSARDNLRRRVPHCLTDNKDGTITMNISSIEDTPASQKIFSGSFPDGDLQITFKDHNYTPNKDCEHMPGRICQSYTWHWDNIAVRGVSTGASLTDETPTPDPTPDPTPTPDVDTTAPTVTLLSPASGTTTSGGPLLLNISATDNVGVGEVGVFVDGTQVSVLDTAPYSYSLSTAPLSVGNHTIFATARDAAGNQAQTSTITIIVPSSPTVIGDVDGDGRVTVNDVRILINNFGRTNATRAQGDLSGDGIVNVNDVRILINNFRN